MFFDNANYVYALFLYNESISSLTYNVFNIHIKYKVSHNKNMSWHHICYLSKQTGFYAWLVD